MSTAPEARWAATEYDLKFKALREFRWCAGSLRKRPNNFLGRTGLLASDTDRAHDYRPRQPSSTTPMHEIQSQIEIASTAEQVWSVLTDFPAYSAWNPFIRSVDGLAEKGQRLTVSIQPQGGRAMTFRPTILVATPRVELRWLGHLLFRCIFDGEHYFHIEPSTAGRVRFTQGERFSGLIVGLARASLDRGTKAGFLAMNEALKSRAENGPTP